MSNTIPEPPTKPPGKHHSLRVRVGLIVGGVMIALAAVTFGLMSWALKNYFGHLQDKLTSARLQQVTIVLNREARAKMHLVQNDAEWDETWDFLKGKNPEFLQRNYSLPINSSGEPVVMVFDEEKKLVAAVESSGEESVYEPPKGLDLSALAAGRLMQEVPTAGLARDEQGVLLLAACPITRSDSMKPSIGWLVFGSYLTEHALAEIGEMTGVDVSLAEKFAALQAIKTDVRMEIETELLGPVSLEFPSAFWSAFETEKVSAQMNFQSVSGEEGVSMHVVTPMTVYRSATGTKNWIIALATICGLVITVVGLVTGELLIIRPLVALDEGLHRMVSAPQDQPFLETSRQDEIGRLSRSANGLLRRAMAGRNAAEHDRALLASVLENTSEGVVAFRAIRGAAGAILDLEFMSLNPAAERVLRVKAAEVLGKTVREIYPRLIESGVYDRWVRAGEAGQSTSFEAHYEGNRVSGWFHNSVGIWEEGLVVTVQDITDRKQKEQELAESYAEIDRFNAAMIGREERIISMKKEVNELRARLALPALYEISDEQS